MSGGDVDGKERNLFPCVFCHHKYIRCDFLNNEGMDLRNLAKINSETGMCDCFKELNPKFPYIEPNAKKALEELETLKKAGMETKK
jgi:hypothetical protein